MVSGLSTLELASTGAVGSAVCKVPSPCHTVTVSIVLLCPLPLFSESAVLDLTSPEIVLAIVRDIDVDVVLLFCLLPLSQSHLHAFTGGIWNTAAAIRRPRCPYCKWLTTADDGKGASGVCVCVYG